MKVIFCEPQLTMEKTEKANMFLNECKRLLDTYVCEKVYISNKYLMNRILETEAEKEDILIFFNSENGDYDIKMQKLVQKYSIAQSRIWPIAMESNPECRMPPEPVLKKQSFDVPSRIENRNHMKNNLKAVAQIFARKIVAQTLSPLYRDEVLYFISHRRSDGERITARLADELKN